MKDVYFHWGNGLKLRPSFMAGKVDPPLQSRIDIEKYKMGLNAPHWMRLSTPKPSWWNIAGWYRWRKRQKYLRQVSKVLTTMLTPPDEQWFIDMATKGSAVQMIEFSEVGDPRSFDVVL